MEIGPDLYKRKKHNKLMASICIVFTTKYIINKRQNSADYFQNFSD